MALIENLPADIVLEIVNRLPMVSFICFKCVCKAWYNLACHQWIKTQYELKEINPCLILHRQKSPQAELYFIEDYETGARIKIRVPFLKSMCVIDSVLSCQGLICVAYSKMREKRWERHVCVFNPVTSEFNHFPNPELLVDGDMYNDAFGFGFDSNTKEYKVIKVGQVSTIAMKVQILNLSKTKWGFSEHNYNLGLRFEARGVFVNGRLNFSARKYGDDGKLVVSISLHDEKIMIFGLISGLLSDFDEFLLVARGYLFLPFLGDLSPLRIWRMTEHGVETSWAEEFNLKPNHHTSFGGRIQPLFVNTNGEVMFLHMGSLWCYNEYTGRFRVVRKDLISPVFQATAHVASSISPFF